MADSILSTMDLQELENIHSSGAVPRRPLTIVRGEGARLFDDQGRSYIDCASAQGWANLGHGHPAVLAAIREQAGKLIAHTEGSYNDQRALWYRDMARRLELELGASERGLLSRFHACSSGAEAIEGALKVARILTSRTDFVCLSRSFHGRTFGALTATANPKYRDPFQPLLPGFSHVAPGDVPALEAAVTDKTAGILLEVIQGEGGVHPVPRETLDAAARLCRERGALLIVDEIQTGIGRTGRWFASQHFGVAPDILCLAKSLGGGIPMGTVVWRDGLGGLPEKTHGSTFGGNPLACAASRAVLRVIEEEGLIERGARLGERVRERLNSLDAPIIRDVRGLGLLIGVELKKKVTPVLKELVENGVFALAAGVTVLRLMPPLVISEEDLDLALDAVGRVLTGGSKK